MILSDEQRKRGVGSTRILWPKVNGELDIPYTIKNDSKLLK